MNSLLVENLSILASAPNGMRKIRQLILQLAIRGRLVPQEPTDEHASELLKQIVLHKQKILAGKAAKDVAGVVTEAEHAFAIPQGWIWSRLGTITINRDADRVPLSAEQRASRKGPYDYYGASGVIDNIDDFLFDRPMLLIGEDGANLINRSTPIAFIAQGKYWVNNHAHVLEVESPILMEYLAIYINAISLLPYITGTAQPKMNQGKMNQIPIALPPLREQQRIVARLNELMALCDRLERKLQDSRRLQEVISTALINQALGKSGPNVVMAEAMLVAT